MSERKIQHFRDILGLINEETKRTARYQIWKWTENRDCDPIQRTNDVKFSDQSKEKYIFTNRQEPKQNQSWLGPGRILQRSMWGGSTPFITGQYYE